MTDPPSSRVIKLGGSLLELPDLADRLREWLARQSPARSLVIVGGGQFVDELRALDELHHFGDEACHWLAIRAMSLTARLLQALAPEWPLITRLDELANARGVPAILDPGDFLLAEERAEKRAAAWPPLPHSWGVTSDSIAAHVAGRAGAAELVLLKSSLPPEHMGTDLAAAVGYVDACFPQASRGLRVRCVNLRDSACPQRWLAPV